MSTPIKNPTGWRPGNGQGSVVIIGLVPLRTNTGVKLVTNTTALPLLTNPTITNPKNPTTWTEQG